MLDIFSSVSVQLRLQLSDEMLTNLFGVVTTVTDKRLEAVATS